MADVHSSYTELPLSCKSAAERMTNELTFEDQYADLSDDNCRSLTELENRLAKETGENIALVAYRL